MEGKDKYDAVSIAIEASKQEHCKDCISIKTVLEMAYDVSEIDGEHFTEPRMVVDVEDIQKLQFGTPLSKGPRRKFEEIVVEYPPAELCTYPEYRGKPYFSIKYEENGEHFIGFGTYKPEVLSRYLREYFIMPPCKPESEE